jgi:hypothetical protein
VNERGPRKGPPEKRSGGRRFEGIRAEGRNATWQRVDRVLEVRTRVVFVLDSIECGNVRTAEDCLLQLLDDLDAAEFLTAKAA